MFHVYFGNFAKRKNSTARPASLGSAVAVALKADCSIDRPVFLLTASSFDFNYCQWGNRYYYITDIVSERNNGWRVSCELDFLATYKDNILATNAFVEYAANGNDQIVDTRLGVEYGVAGVNSDTVGITPLAADINACSYFLTIIGKESTDTFMVSATALEYIMGTADEWANLIIERDDIISTVASSLQQIIASGSAADCVRSAYALPIVTPTSAIGSSEKLFLGNFDTGIYGNRVLGNGNIRNKLSVSIPHQYADWRKNAPYEVVQLFLPLYGVVNIPSDIATDSTALSIDFILNVRSGDFTYYVSGNGRSGYEICVGGNCSAPVPVGASNVNPMHSVSSGLSTISMGAAVGAGVGAIAAAAAVSMSLVQPAPQSTGANGGISNRHPRAVCMVYYRKTSAEPASVAPSVGIPLLAQRQLSTLSGYVQTRDASVSGVIRGEYYNRINGALDSGVFIE